VPVPPVRPDTPVEQRRFDAARKRRDARISARKEQAAP